MSKKHILFILLILITTFSNAQKNYLSYEHSFFGFSHSNNIKPVNGVSERINVSKGNSGMLSFRFYTGPQSFFGIGVGLSSISYQKEFMGVFPENNKFGAAIVNGSIGYWSYPISFNLSAVNSFRSNNHYIGYRSRYKVGFSFTYIPSFERSNTFSVITFGEVDRNAFLTNFKNNSRTFQHSLTIGLNNQFYFLRNKMMLGLEPYAGVGSSHFKESKSTFNFCYGINLRIGISAKLPKISIEREAKLNSTAEEKKKLLEQKQKEIQDQLNKNPK